MSDDDGVALDRAAGRIVAAVVALSAVVVGFFVFALVVVRPVDGVVLVVVGDPAPAPGAITPLRVLGLHRDRPVPLRVRLEGGAIDHEGYGGALANTKPWIFSGVATTTTGEREVALTIPAPTMAAKAAPTLKTTPWTTALAAPAAGAAVYPEHGLVAGRGRSRVVLVDDKGVAVVDVEPLVDARLPDGRLLAFDRQPLRATIDAEGLGDGNIVVVLEAREAVHGVIDVHVDGRLVVLEPVEIVAGATRWRHRLDVDSGAIVALNVSMSSLPSAARAQTIARVGGWRDAELLAVEPRAAAQLADPIVRRALAARFVDSARPAVLSPSFEAQERAWRQRATDDATAARQRFRMAGVVLLLVVTVLAALTRARVLQAVVAVVIVAVVVVGLDAVLGLTIGDVVSADGASLVGAAPA